MLKIMGRLGLAILLVVVLLTANILVGCAGAAEGTAEWHYEQGNELLNQGQYDEAIKNFDEAIRLNPQYSHAYNNRGTTYANLGQLGRAIKDYDEAIRLNPNNVEAYYNRGLAYEEQGKKAEAMADFEKFISLTDDPQQIFRAKQMIAELSK